MDYDYRKISSELVFDLINRDNPNLPFGLTTDNCYLGTPTAITEVNGRNTQVMVVPKSNSGYRSNFKVKYRRLNPANLFPNGAGAGKAYIDTWFGTGSSATIQQWCDAINQKYGTMFQPSDFTVTTLTTSSGAKTLSIASACLAYVGSLSIQRVAPEQPIDTLVPEVTSGVATPLLGVPATDADLLTYAGDFSRFATLLNTYTTTTTLQTSTATDQQDELINFMGKVANKDLNIYRAVTVQGGMGNIRVIRYTLPNANVPEANSEDFNSVAVVTTSAGSAWFTGKFLLHYNS